jgi:hypothetical protein
VKIRPSVKRFLPVTARLRARLLGNSSVFACASEIVELAPACERMQPSAICLPDEFDRVQAVEEANTVPMDLDRLGEGSRRHGPTVAYRIDGAVLAQGTLYCGSGYQVIRSGSKRLRLNRNQDHLAEMQLCSNYVIERYFGHWMADGLALELLAAQRSITGLKLAGNPWLHEPGYRELFDLQVTRSDNARVDRLWVIDDRGINHGWISRFEELRRRVQSVAVANHAKRVMLTRGTLGSERNLVNSSEVQEALVRLGFDIVHPELESARSITERLRGAEIVITVEGSAQGHCWLSMQRRSSFVAIQPPTRFNALGKVRADAAGINYGYVVADPHAKGFRLPVDRLMRTIDEVVRVAALRR